MHSQKSETSLEKENLDILKSPFVSLCNVTIFLVMKLRRTPNSYMDLYFEKGGHLQVCRNI